MAGNRMAFNGSFDLTGQPPVPTQREQYGLGQGLDYALQADPYAAQRAETAAQDDTGPDYFGKGRRLRDAVGYGLGAFAQGLGGSNPYDALLKRQSDLQLYGRKQQAEAQARAAERLAQRGDKREDFEWQETYKRNNPEPPAMVKNLAAWSAMTPEQQAQYAAMLDITAPIAVSGPGGTARVPRTFGQSLGAGDGSGRNIVRTGTAPDGRKVNEYDDGTIDYGD